MYLQILQCREEFNFQSCCPNQESTDQGSPANMHTPEEAHRSEALLFFVVQSTAETLKISVLHIRNGFYR